MAFRWQANDGSFRVVFGSSLPLSTTKTDWTPLKKKLLDPRMDQYKAL